MKQNRHLLPRLIRLKDASYYLGMDKERFNKEVRPLLTEIPIGSQGKAFDRLDLDRWVDYYKSRSGRPSNMRLRLWDEKERRVSSNEGSSGMLINKFSDNELEKVLEQIRLKKRKST